MPYADLTALVARSSEQVLIQLTDDKKLGTIDQPTVDDALLGADDLINRHLRTRYTLPLADVPPGLRDIAAWLALYQLYSRRLTLAVPSTLQDKYDQAIAELEKLAGGKTTLAITTSASTGGPGPILSNASLRTREWTRDMLRRFR